MEERPTLPTYVSLDLETTGLNHEVDAIIEIGAVKFRGQEVEGTFQTLVNPYRELPEFVQRLTGVSQRSLDMAPPFGAVAAELGDFLGTLPLVGHNISFDLRFLSRHGLQLSNESQDTWDLVSILMPYLTDYSLPGLALQLGTGHTRPHRALDDAQATHRLFVHLLDRVGGIDPAASAYIHHLASRSRWPLARLFSLSSSVTDPADLSVTPTGGGLMGLDMEALAKRVGRADQVVKPSNDMVAVDEEEIVSYLAPGGLISRALPDFEHRPQQVEMMRAVAGAIRDDEHLIVEAGTGVGKSLAYLLPAMLHSVKNGTRVVVSTNTINLQEQLLQKDIPALVEVLEREGVMPQGKFRAVPLKGRANYLCLRLWNQVARGESLERDEARLLSKTLIWLSDTGTGDRGEINLAGRDAITWNRVSAGEKFQCPGLRGEGTCFLRAARDRAEGAHLIVVNHALLLSDLALGGGLLPEYQHLIIDEGHHLEEVATHQMSFQVSQNRLGEEMDSLAPLLGEARVVLRLSSSSSTQVALGESLAAELDNQWPKRMRDAWDRLWSQCESFLIRHREEDGGQSQLRITRGTRAQPAWSDLEIAWENVDVGLTDGINGVERLARFLDTLPGDRSADRETLILGLSSWREGLEDLQEQIKTLFAAPADEQRIDWMALVEDGRDGSGRSNMVFHSAPLDLGPELEERLFSQKGSVVLTSATLSTQGGFNYIRQRVGLAESRELLVGSPFDYVKAAQMLIPEDMPMPNEWAYQQAMERLLTELVKALEGHSLVLFTSHAALRGAAKAIRGQLETEGIRVRAQGVDGSPRQVLASFTRDPRSVILGTSSFWEGVDVSGGLLRALVLARLPFNVPTDPIFSARSAQYEDSFNEYALPQAVLRFRQGIGRLIRSSRDVGNIVVLDRRIVAKSYGRVFLDSIPPCTVRRAPMSAIPGYAVDWVKDGR